MSVLTDLRIGETATLIALDLPESVQNYLMHMGFVPDAQVTALRKAPAGDPTVYASTGWKLPSVAKPPKQSVFAATWEVRKAKSTPN